ncbi:TPA: hypothetical protein U1B50_002065 [Streptococcus suis]|nr:hypothetical protein [Streptococcus suis]HEM3546687.1 hypothetical protein [Streptococcus suis]
MTTKKVPRISPASLKPLAGKLEFAFKFFGNFNAVRQFETDRSLATFF